MKLVYSNQQLFLVVNAKNILENAGIESQVRNEFIAGAAGDISPFDAWPELWVNEASFDKAQELLKMHESIQQTLWRCNECGEENTSAFELCWNCGKHSE